MVNGISSSQQAYTAQMQQTNRKPPSADEMFGKLTDDVGGDGKSITKDQLESYISKLESDSSVEDKGKLGFLKQLDSNFDKISGGSDSITADNLKSNMELLKPPSGGFKSSASRSVSNMFSDLSDKVGADSTGITKDDLQNYLKKLQDKGNSDSKESEMISSLIENFDKVAGGTDKITSDSMQTDFQNNINNRQQWQDPSSITSDQLQPPIDISV